MAAEIQEIMESEKARIQSLLCLFNERGGYLKVSDEGNAEPFVQTLVDSFTVTRVAPVFDAHGRLVDSVFWLLWKSVGYNNGFQYCHTTKIEKAYVDDTLESQFQGNPVNAWLIVELTDDRKRIHHIELIEPNQERELAEDWQEWQVYKRDNAEIFRKIDAEILKEHLTIAREWR
jgi:hypothetical protein